RRGDAEEGEEGGMSAEEEADQDERLIAGVPAAGPTPDEGTGTPVALPVGQAGAVGPAVTGSQPWPLTPATAAAASVGGPSAVQPGAPVVVDARTSAAAPVGEEVLGEDADIGGEEYQEGALPG